MNSERMGNVKKKIILLLSAGVALGMTKRINKQSAILQEVSKEWRAINRDSLRTSLISLYNSNVISLHPKGDAFEIMLSQKGKKLAIRLDLETMKIQKQNNWDGKWRIVLFDIPEKLKKVREAIRFHFRDVGLVEYQKSVLISPYPCEKKIKFISEFYHVRKHIRFIVAQALDDEKIYKKKFGIR